MRSVIIDSVRERQANAAAAIPSDSRLSTQLLEGRKARTKTCYALTKRLTRLAQAEPRLAKVVEMRYFGGYTEAEIAEALELTERTVRRDWDKARLLLSEILNE